MVTFYFKRLARLFPALLLLIVVITFVQMCLPYLARGGVANTLRSDLVALLYMMNRNRAFRMYPDGVLGHTWSLSIEEQFYFFWPLLLWVAFAFGGRLGALVAASALATASIILRFLMYVDGASIDRLYNGFDVRADGLLIGCMLALWRPAALSKPAGRWCLIPVVPILVFLCYPWEVAFTLSSTINALASAWLILVLWFKTNARLASVLETQWLRYLGRISYGLYLWHYPVIMLLRMSGLFHRGWQVTILAALVTVLLSSLAFHFVERPIIKFAHRKLHQARWTTAHAST